jgi:hypothetical protein
MSKPIRRLSISILALSLLALLATPVAQASKSQFSVMQDDGLLQSPDPAVRDAALDEMKALGTRTVKIAMIWRNVAPGATSSSKPAGFNGSDPAAYGGGFAGYRAIVDAIHARGMNAWLIVNTPAPDWAVRKRSVRQPGVNDPSAAEFGKFTEAAGKVFPDVKTWSILNEPNHYAFLEPQVKKSGVIYSAVMYRKIFYAARAGLASSGHNGDRILFGAMAPRASAPKKGARSVHPVAFLRQFFCLDEKLKPVKGQLAKDLGCRGSFKKIVANGFAYHPYTNAKGPLSALPNTDDAMIGQLPRLYRVLDKAYARKRLSQRRISLWNAEFGYQTYPPDRCWAKLSQVPAFINIAEYMSWKDRRVANYIQYQLRDEPSRGLCDPGFQSGLRFADDSKKPGIYEAYELPIVAERTRTSGKVKVWGGIRAFGGGTQTVEIQVRNGSAYETVSSVLVTSPSGYFQTVVSLPGASGKTWRIAFNGKNSRSTKAVRTVKPKR